MSRLVDYADPEQDCPFCKITHGQAPAKRFVRTYEHDSAISVFEPLDPVVPWDATGPGHLLVVPRTHVVDAADSPRITGLVMTEAAWLILVLANLTGDDWNLVTSIGEHATQTVPHLHAHVVRRREGDGLHLPWTGQVKADTPESTAEKFKAARGVLDRFAELQERGDR